MTTNMPLTDAVIETALARYAERISSDGLQDEIMAGVGRTGRSRPPLAARIDWLALPWTLRAVPAFAWLVLLGLVVTSLIAGALLVGSRPESPITESLPRHPAALVPTGVGWVAPETDSPSCGWAVADPNGVIWASANGAIGRLDPSSGAVRTWTHADDDAFECPEIVAARGGGVWLVPWDGSVDQALRWFDGERYRDVVPAPPGGSGAFAEAPDGSLWMGSPAGLFYWDGTSWSAAPAGRPVAGVAALAIDRTGRVWVGNCEDSAGACSGRGGRGVSRFDGTQWETFPDVAPPDSMVEAPDGSFWVAGGGDVYRYDGHSWTKLRSNWRGDWIPSLWHLTWAPDGALWATECSFPYGDPGVGRFDGSRWWTWPGLPVGGDCASVAATARGVYVGTPDDGLYRLIDDDGVYSLRDDRWEHVWP